jgi:molecular chaperone DnaJ
MSKDYYKILGIEKDATQDEIKKSYRKMAMKYHPDKNNGDVESEEKFKECAEAFDVLSDPQKKQEYDTYGSVGGNGGNPFGGFGMEDIFSRFGDFFGFGNGQSNRVKRGNDLRLRVQLSIDDIINGVDKKIKYIRQVHCNTCNGIGGKDVSTCGGCNGTGQRRIVQNTPFGMIQQVVTCNSCSGTGEIIRTPCNSCRGNGTVPKEETVDIQIPRGATNGMKLSMSQQGNYIKNGIPGDLQIYIDELQNSPFKREGINLVFEQSISVVDAILGKEINLKTPHGDIKFTSTPGTNHGKVVKIQGKGIPDINRGGFMGDLFIKMNIKIPQKINEEERKILNDLKSSENFN